MCKELKLAAKLAADRYDNSFDGEGITCHLPEDFVF